ncbi:unnamed protein product [Caenorhabditis nigoni]
MSVSPSSTTLHGNAVLVRAAVKALTAASSELTDVLTTLNELGPKAATLFRSFVRIGTIVSQNISSQSNEYKELKILNNQTQMLWKDMDSKIEENSDIFEFHPSWSLYKMNMRLVSLELKEYVDKFYDPKENKNDDFMKKFEQRCSSSNLDSILPKLRFHLVYDCKSALTPTDAQTMADKRVYFMQILLRLQVKNKTIPDFEIYLEEFLSYFEKPIEWNFLDRPLRSYTNQFKNYKSATDALFNELRETFGVHHKSVSTCFLRNVVSTKNFNNLPVMAFVSKLRSELIKLTYLSAACATVQFKDARNETWFEDQIVEDVTLIATHVSQYLNNSLLSAWPATHNGILKEQILLNIPNPKNVDQNQLKMVTNLTRSLLANIGLPNYVYQILIVRATGDKHESYFNGEGTRCTFQKQISGFDTIIGRIPFNSTDQFGKLQLGITIEKQRAAAAELNQIIQSEMDVLYADRTVSVIAYSLKDKIGKDILLDYKFSCWAIIREWRWMPCPEIKYWSSSYIVYDVGSITDLSYKNKGSFTQDCEDFRFFFFV